MDTIFQAPSGVFHLSWWGYVVYVLIVTHITIFSVTIFLHRYSAHRALDLHPLIQHFFRFWLWLTTGMFTKTWTAIHREHQCTKVRPTFVKDSLWCNLDFCNYFVAPISLRNALLDGLRPRKFFTSSSSSTLPPFSRIDAL